MIATHQSNRSQQQVTRSGGSPCRCGDKCKACPRRLGNAESTSTKIDIRIVDTPEEREAVFRFRYRVYVEEMNRDEPYADHAGRRIEEPADQHNTLFAAFRASKVVGTVRVHLGTETDGFYSDFYRMREFSPFFPLQTSITTKLMVDASRRGSAIAVRLAMASFTHALLEGMRFDFIDCNTHLKPFFERLGYKQMFGERDHPVYGHVHPMVIDLHDWFHFLKIRSPFAQLLPDNGSIAPLGWNQLIGSRRMVAHPGAARTQHVS